MEIRVNGRIYVVSNFKMYDRNNGGFVLEVENDNHNLSGVYRERGIIFDAMISKEPFYYFLDKLMDVK